MVRVILAGCNGKMGTVVSNYANKQEHCVIVAGLDRAENPNLGYPVFSSPDACTVQGDVVLDFSNAGGLESCIQLALAQNIPLVVAATGPQPRPAGAAGADC